MACLPISVRGTLSEHNDWWVSVALIFLKRNMDRALLFLLFVIAIVSFLLFISAGQNRETKTTEDARKAGEQASIAIFDNFMFSLTTHAETLSKKGLLTIQSANEALSNQNVDAEKTMEILGDVLKGSKEDMQNWMNIEGSNYFAALSEDDMTKALKDPTAAITAVIDNITEQVKARTELSIQFDARLNDLQQRFGMSSEEIYNLANETGTNLMDATMDYVVMVERLGFNSSSLDSISESFNLSKASETSDLLKIFKILVEGLSKYLD